MASIVSTSAQTTVGGAVGVLVAEIVWGEQFPLVVRCLTPAGEAVNIAGAALSANAELYAQCSINSAGKLTQLDGFVSGRMQTWQVVATDDPGVLQILVPFDLVEKNDVADPGSDSIPGRLVFVGLSTDFGSYIARAVVVVRHGSGIAPPGSATLPIAGLPVNYDWVIGLPAA